MFATALGTLPIVGARGRSIAATGAGVLARRIARAGTGARIARAGTAVGARPTRERPIP